MLGTGMAVRFGIDDENGFAKLEGPADTGIALGLSYNGSRSYNGLGEFACGMAGT